MEGINKSNLSHKDSFNRRNFLRTAGIAGASALLISGLRSKVDAAISPEKSYPQIKIANIRDLQTGSPVTFDYPLLGRKSILIDMGCKVEGGLGPDRSIVAYSMFCSHLGCSVEMEWESGMLVCECHQSVYDPKKSGRVVEGPAPGNLPMVNLSIDSSTGDIYAVGVAGLIYGLRNNLLDGQEVQ